MLTQQTLRPFVDFKKLRIDEHAVQRAKERFKRKSELDALNYCKCLLGAARYIGETTCERGNRAHMFVAPNSVAIYLTLDLTVIKTIMKINDKEYIVYDKEPESENASDNEEHEHIFSKVKGIPLQDKLIKLYQIEFKKHDRLDKKMTKEFTEFKLVKSVEIATLQLQEFKCKSNTKKVEIADKIKEIEQVLIENELKLKKVQDDKRKISYALSTLLKN